MKILTGIIIVGIVIFIVLNIMACSMSLGYVIEEKHPNRKDFFDKTEIFWRSFWRKIIK